MTLLRSLIPPGLVLLVGVCLTWVAYGPSLGGPLVLDDNAHLTALASLDRDAPWQVYWQAMVSSNASVTGRPVAMATFVADAWVHGFDPRVARAVNVSIHIVIGVLIFFALRLWFATWRDGGRLNTSIAWMAALVAVVWLVHPFNLTSVAYLIQRMNSLSALLTILGVLIYSHERLRQQSHSGRWGRTGVGLAACLVLATLSKENGALLPVYLLIVEMFVFRWRTAFRRDLQVLRAGFVLVLALPAAVLVGSLVAHWAGLFELPIGLDPGRILTQSRALVWYLQMILVPDLSQLSLFHDGFATSRDLVTPASTLLALIFWLGVVSVAWTVRHQLPWFAFGLAWFLGGHLMESTVLPLEPVYEHRNYLPSLGILVLAAGAAVTVASRLRFPPKALAISALAVILVLSGTTSLRAQRWSADPAARLAGLATQPESPRANLVAAGIYSDLAAASAQASARSDLLARAELHYAKVSELRPESAMGRIGLLILRAQHNIAFDAALSGPLLKRLRYGELDEVGVNAVHSLVTCWLRRRCQSVSVELMEQILQALAANERMSSHHRSLVLRDYARFLALGRSDVPAALERAREADRVAGGELAARVDLIRYQLVLGEREAARAGLDDLAERDWLGRYAATRAHLRRALEHGGTLELSMPTAAGQGGTQ